MAAIERRRTIAACIDLMGGNSYLTTTRSMFFLTRISERMELIYYQRER